MPKLNLIIPGARKLRYCASGPHKIIIILAMLVGSMAIARKWSKPILLGSRLYVVNLFLHNRLQLLNLGRQLSDRSLNYHLLPITFINLELLFDFDVFH